jgi:hypothetical protein
VAFFDASPMTTTAMAAFAREEERLAADLAR